MLASTLQSRGGKARAAALSPARRAEIAKKAATARWAAFARGEQSGERSVGGMLSAGAQQLEALAGAVGLKGSAVKAALHTFSPEAKAVYGATPPDGTPIMLRIEPVKPRRALPKAGTVNALVLAAMSIKPLTVEQIYERTAGDFTFAQARNALSSLRSGGHVVSEPKPGSAKEKLWRLA